MVRFNTISALAFTSLLPYMVSAECLDPLTGASITEGAWNMNGVNSTWQPARLDDSNINTQNPGWTVPDAALWTYPAGEMGQYGPNYKTQHTCSMLTFCNPENAPDDSGVSVGGRKLVDAFSQQDVWKLASKELFDVCDFTGAELLGTTSATSCVEVVKDDLTTEGEKSYYASKENCEAGQKLAVAVTDWESISIQCAAIAVHTPASSRIRSCDCDFNKTPFSARYASLCAKAYQESCFKVMQPGDCCETSTCFSTLETFDTPEGKEYELARRETCDDDIPGNCYNMEGTATDVSADGSTDCCSQTCSSCGSEVASGASFEPCTSNTPDAMTATCGKLSRYAQDNHICDFSKCPENSHWGSEKESVWKYMGINKFTDKEIPNDGGVTDIAKPTPTVDKATEKPMDMDANKSDSGAPSSVSLVLSVLSAGFVAALL